MITFLPGRFQLLHKGHVQLLKAVAQHADHIKILLTHADVCNEQNPIPVTIRQKILETALAVAHISNYTIRHATTGTGPISPERIDTLLATYALDPTTTDVVSGSQLVHAALSPRGFICHTPASLITEPAIPISGTRLRDMIGVGNTSYIEHLAPGTEALFIQYNIAKYVHQYAAKKIL